MRRLVEIKSGCKVKLYLEITGRRADGYHELASLFYPLPEPSDLLSLEILDTAGDFELSCSLPGLRPSENLVYKAWQAFGRASGFQPGLAGHLEKGVPCGAGLGGGSANAAGLLGFLNQAAGRLALDKAALAGLAAELGADVPFFLDNVPAWARGIGEKLSPSQPKLAGFSLLLLCPDRAVNTAWAYREWDSLERDGAVKNPPRFLTSRAGRNTEPSFFDGLLIWNSFEQAVFPAHPELGRLKQRLLRLGAAAAGLSGSGAALFGLFRERERARWAAKELRAPKTEVFVHDF